VELGRLSCRRIAGTWLEYGPEASFGKGQGQTRGHTAICSIIKDRFSIASEAFGLVEISKCLLLMMDWFSGRFGHVFFSHVLRCWTSNEHISFPIFTRDNDDTLAREKLSQAMAAM
jgi:hypothetical protein